jgi:hypothetical protein
MAATEGVTKGRRAGVLTMTEGATKGAATET